MRVGGARLADPGKSRGGDEERVGPGSRRCGAWRARRGWSAGPGPSGDESASVPGEDSAPAHLHPFSKSTGREIFMGHLLPFNAHRESAASTESWEGVLSLLQYLRNTGRSPPETRKRADGTRVPPSADSEHTGQQSMGRLRLPDSNELKSTENVEQTRKLAAPVKLRASGKKT